MVAQTLIWDLVDPAELISYVRTFANEQLRPDAQFVLGTYLPTVTTDEIEFKIRKGDLDDVDAAKYRAWDTPAPMTARPGTTRIEGELGPISRQIPLSEEEIIRKVALDRGNNDPIVDAIFADAERMVRSVYARLELARGDVINDGKVTLSENGLTLEADFGRAAAFSVTAGITWDTVATSVPIANMLGYVETYVDEHGFAPDHILMPRVTRGHLSLTQEFLDYSASGGTTPTRLNNNDIDAVLAANDLPPIRIYDGQFRVDGVRTRVLPADKIFFMPPPTAAYGETRMGITAEAIKAAEKGFIKSEDAAGVVAVVLGQDHPVQTSTLGTAVGIPITPNPDYVMDATVL